MKRFSVAVAAVMVSFVMILTLGGCRLAERIAGPTDTWCRTEVKYNNDSSSNLQVAFMYTKEGIEGTGKFEQLDSEYEFAPDSLTVVIWAESTISSLGMTQNSYYYKTYTSSKDLLSESGWGSDNSFGNMQLIWTALYWTKGDFEEYQWVHPSAPTPLRNGFKGFKVPDDLTDTNKALFKENFNWKTLLKAVVDSL